MNSLPLTTDSSPQKTVMNCTLVFCYQSRLRDITKSYYLISDTALAKGILLREFMRIVECHMECPLEKKKQDLKVENCVSFRALLRGFPGGSDGKESPCKAGDQGLIPGWGRSPGEGKGYPLQYSCLENSMHRGAWQAIVHEVAKS